MPQNDTALGHQELNDIRDAGVNEIIGYQENLANQALEHLDNELSNSLIVKVGDLRQLQV